MTMNENRKKKEGVTLRNQKQLLPLMETQAPEPAAVLLETLAGGSEST